MKKTKQPKPKKVEPIIQDHTEKEFTEVFETPLQNKMNAFWYRIVTLTETFHISVIAACTSDSQIALKQQYPDATINFLGSSAKIIQVG